MDFKYTLAFIKRDDELLMLNRNFAPWMGSWNGVGGKRKDNEAAIDAIIREIKEETNLTINKGQIIDKGIVTWNSYDENGTGLHVYLVNLDNDFFYQTPIPTNEGILDWKKISWVANYNNYGVCDNIPYFINYVINDEKRYNHQCVFNNNVLISVTSTLI